MCSFSSASDGFYKPPHGPLVTEEERRKGEVVTYGWQYLCLNVALEHFTS